MKIGEVKIGIFMMFSKVKIVSTLQHFVQESCTHFHKTLTHGLTADSKSEMGDPKG